MASVGTIHLVQDWALRTQLLHQEVGEVVAVGLRDGIGSFPPHKLMSCHAELFQVLLAHEKFVKPELHARERFGTVSAQASAS